MKKAKGWKSKLTKKELKHLKEAGNVTTLRAAKSTFAHQAEMRKDFPNASDPCWECKMIARKLGCEV